jgi:hypothetical protein
MFQGCGLRKPFKESLLCEAFLLFLTSMLSSEHYCEFHYAMGRSLVGTECPQPCGITKDRHRKMRQNLRKRAKFWRLTSN